MTGTHIDMSMAQRSAKQRGDTNWKHCYYLYQRSQEQQIFSCIDLLRREQFFVWSLFSLMTLSLRFIYWIGVAVVVLVDVDVDG